MGDITYIPTAEGYCFLATVLDVCSRRLLGWSLQAHMRTTLCTDALLAAAGLRGRAWPVPPFIPTEAVNILQAITP